MKRIRLDTKNLTLCFDLKGIMGPEYLYFGPKKGKDYNFKDCYLKDEQKNICGVIFLRPLLSNYGWFEHREYSFIIKNEDGSYSNEFKFVSVNKNETKYIPIMPSGRNPSQCISFKYVDSNYQISITLVYCAYYDSDVFSCYAVVENNNENDIHLLKASSLSFPINENDFTVVTYNGSWAHERTRTETKLRNGLLTNSSVTGSSSHLHSPFTMMLDKSNHAYGFNLIYSGNHKTTYEAGFFNRMNVIVGINDFLFDWTLKHNEKFYTPEAVFSYGLDENDMSQHFHHFTINHLMNPNWSNKVRPVLLNNWEGTYFDFTADKIYEIAKTSKELGAELFVLDDGWFGQRNSDRAGLGDWYSNKEKTGGGLNVLSKRVKDLGLKFGIWMEPEMVNPDSDLYRNHKEYAMLTPKHNPTLWRNQLMLDLTNEEVKQFVYNTICNIIDEADADYVKWDYNRQMTEIYSKDFPTSEYFHRYMLSFYEILNKVLDKYPHVLFEGCSGGGGRYDLGMFYYFSQNWTSDDCDPRERILIQDSTLTMLPQIVITSHVAKSPNHTTGRTSSLNDRFNVSCSCNLGYELDPTIFTKEEKEQIIEQIDFYKKHRESIQLGKAYRLGYKNICKGVLIIHEEECHLFLYRLEEGKIKIKWPNVFDDNKEYIVENITKKGCELNNHYLDEKIFEGLNIDYENDCKIGTKHIIIKIK